jgi:hypothetical protein
MPFIEMTTGKHAIAEENDSGNIPSGRPQVLDVLPKEKPRRAGLSGVFPFLFF